MTRKVLLVLGLLVAILLATPAIVFVGGMIGVGAAHLAHRIGLANESPATVQMGPFCIGDLCEPRREVVRTLQVDSLTVAAVRVIQSSRTVADSLIACAIFSTDAAPNTVGLATPVLIARRRTADSVDITYEPDAAARCRPVLRSHGISITIEVTPPVTVSFSLPQGRLRLPRGREFRA